MKSTTTLVTKHQNTMFRGLKLNTSKKIMELIQALVPSLKFADIFQQLNYLQIRIGISLGDA